MISRLAVMSCVAVWCLEACSGNTTSAGGGAGSAGGPASATAGIAGTSGTASAGGSAGSAGGPASATAGIAGTSGTASAGGSGGSAGDPSPGTGITGTSSATDATNAQECRFTGGGGANGWSCDYVSVEFSEPLPNADLEIEVTTSGGDALVPTTDASSAFGRPPALFVNVSADGAQALGFTIRGAGHLSQDYWPEWVDVVVSLGSSTAADTRLRLTYSCVALTVDDWCWVAKPEVLAVTVDP